MELLIPEEAQILAAYDHENWKEYAAVTKNTYGRGKAYYIGCMFSRELLENVFLDALKEAGIPAPREKFPVIVRKGFNDAGNEIQYYLNYSSGKQVVTYEGKNAKNLFTGERLEKGDMLSLAPWDLAVLEEKKEF